MKNIKVKLILCGAVALGFSGVALASGNDHVATVVKVSAKSKDDNAAAVVEANTSAATSGSILLGLTVGGNTIHGGTVSKDVKNGMAINGFMMMPMPYSPLSKMNVILNVGYADNKAKDSINYGLEKSSISAGVLYPINSSNKLNVYAGGELGYANYTKKGSGTNASSDEGKMFQQLDVMATYKIQPSWDAIAKIGYNFTKASFTGFVVKDSNAVQWSIGVAHSV